MKKNFLIIGHQGAGKTTLADRLMEILCENKAILIEECIIQRLRIAIKKSVGIQTPIIICMQKEVFDSARLTENDKLTLEENFVIVNL